MTGIFALDWAVLAISLFNTILLLWLGLTVFLNAEARGWGIWLAAGGLLLGAIFFTSHSVILGHGIQSVTLGLNFWWQTGWIPVAALPLAWYVLMLWYSGFWQPEGGTKPAENRLHQRHQAWLYLAAMAGLILTGLLLFSNPLPSFSQLVAFDLVATASIDGIPLLILAYPVYTLLCTGLSLDALRHPEPSGRLMGDLARSRAQRWLVSASVVLLSVGLLVGYVMVWVVRSMQQGILSLETLKTVGWLDFVIEMLIAGAILLLGQAVVTYEVFTGKSLPRRGLSQYWRRAVILASGYSLVLAWSLSLQLRPIYSLLLSMLLMVVFYALLGWRAYAERERFIQNLRPFVAHERLYEGILEGEKNQPDAGEVAVNEPFNALCASLLEARQACLVPLGPLAPLSGTPLNFPQGARFSLPNLSEVIPRLSSPTEPGIPLDPEKDGGMVFAISLWSERGLTGVLLLGEKQSGGLYTQEEIEIARAVGEHLMDTKASMEMARRLVSLQRQRLVHSQVLDQQTRRILHDEVLPMVHTSLLNLTGPENEQGKVIPESVSLLEEIHHLLSDLLRATPATSPVEVGRLGCVGALRRAIEVEMQGWFDEVTWEIQAEGERKLEAIPAVVAEVLFFASREAMRNAARHGRRKDGAKKLCLWIGLKYQNGLVMTIEDNGAGFAMDEEENLGPSSLTHEPAGSSDGGSGQGLALHSTMMAVIGGFLSVESAQGQYTRVTLELPEAAWQSWSRT
ncbi:MAG: ATP-binding protein [Anaerolineales bacterium]|jgi:signal transduction histidine kinase